jgi:uncharacterized protein YutE (UPF0331/DUF86 family)
MGINHELVERKIALILEDLDRLRGLASLSEQQYLADERNEALVERYLERMVGRILDVNYHLAVESSSIVPRDYSDSFLKLADIGVLEKDRAAYYVRLAGLRNRITHEYNGLDSRLVHQAVQEAVTQIPALLRAYRAFLSFPPRTPRAAGPAFS